MLPMTVLRRLDCVLEPSKSKVLEEQKKLKGQNPAYVQKMLQRAAKRRFYNTGKYDFDRLKADSEGLAKTCCITYMASPRRYARSSIISVSTSGPPPLRSA